MTERLADFARPRDAIAARLRGAGMSQERAMEVAIGCVEEVFAAGFKFVHPERMKEDCPDPWTCCIHEPKDVI